MAKYKTDKYGHRYFKGTKYAYWKEAGTHKTRASALARAKHLREKQGYMARVAKEGNHYVVWVS